MDQVLARSRIEPLQENSIPALNRLFVIGNIP